MIVRLCSEGVKVHGPRYLLGLPWPWRWHRHWQWYAGPGPFAADSGLILWGMTRGVVTPFFQLVWR